MITIKEAITKKEITEYIKFPFTLYKNNKYWVPPLIADELEAFNKETNPVFKTAEAYFYLAYRDNKIVGRITAIINWDEVNILKKRKVRFGWFDVIDDIEVTKALLEKVYELGQKNELEYMEGPMGFSNLDKVGVLTDGYDQLGTMITWYNHPYYVDHFEKLGFTTEKEYKESNFDFKNVNAEVFERAQAMVKKRYELRAINFKTTKDVLPYVENIFKLFNESYAKLESFVPISDEQINYFKNKYIGLINPEYIKYVVDKNDEVVAFSIVMPNFAKALQKANGKLFPFGFLHLLNAKKNSKEVVFYLIGVHPNYINKGVTAIISDEYTKTFTKKGIQKCIITPELVDNLSIQNLWKNYDPSDQCRRKTYRKNI
jgi:hypothetical protein